jgi:hypothetical protein
MPTSDERREVAARLRKAADADEWLDVSVANAIFGAMGEVKHPIASVLADLMDPTCEVESVDSTGGLLAYRLSCGPTAYRPAHVQGPPPVCPTCGARVTDGGEG